MKTEDGGSLDYKVPIKDLLDRIEILCYDNERVSLIRRAYNDRDLMSVFKLSGNDNLRRAVMEDNLHSLFRILEDYEPTLGTHIDLRKSILEKNLHSLFRLLENFNISITDPLDLKKAILDQNLHAIFRLYSDTDDLRKSVLDQQINSILRLFKETKLLRKAVVDKDLHSVLMLLDQEDLSKMILQDNRFSMYRILLESADKQLIKSLKKIEESEICFSHDCISRGQLKSKLWLVNQLEKLDQNLGCVFICAGWYATLATMMFESNLRIDKIRSFDIDAECQTIAEIFNKPWVIDNWKFKASTADIFDLNYYETAYSVRRNDGQIEYLYDCPSTVINTSCEHINNFQNWYQRIPKGVLIVLQNNNFSSITDHVNCCNTLGEFADQTPMEKCLYQGDLELDGYTRFMRIGYR